MSGMEVIGGISAVITVLEKTIEIYDNALRDVKLSATFEVVRRRMPVLLHILQTCRNELEPHKNTMPPDVCNALEAISDSCDEKARKLKEIFEKVISGENETWEKRYVKIIRRFGKGHQVEELLVALTEDVQLIVNNNAVINSVKPEQNYQLEAILIEVRALKGSSAKEKHPALTFQSGGGRQTNNINSGSGQQINNNGHVRNQHFYHVMLSPAQDEDADEDEEGRMSDFSNESEVMNYRRIQCFHCKAYGHMRYNCPELQACKRCGDLDHDEESCTRQNGYCRRCNIYGHYARDCRVPPWKWRN